MAVSRFSVDDEAPELLRTAVFVECNRIASVQGPSETADEFVSRLLDRVFVDFPQDIFRGVANPTDRAGICTLGLVLNHELLERHVARCAHDLADISHKDRLLH